MDYILEHSFDDAKNCWIVNISGEIDIFNSSQMKLSLLELVNEKNVDVYINCRDLLYIDSTALGALVAVLKNVKVYEGEIHLINVKPSVAKIFRITNLDKVFMIEGELNE